jgi:sulfur carrier protein
MRIELNGEAAELVDGATVEDAVRSVGIELNGRGVAVAVDGDVVRRPDWQAVALREGQSVEIVRAVQGG